MIHNSLTHEPETIKRRAGAILSRRLLYVFPVLLTLLLATGFLAQRAIADDVRTINFAGHDWIVKSGYIGPGPNHWSDDPESVWVDGDGALHLKIRQIDGVWHSAEVYLPDCTQYGAHRFSIQSPIDDLDPNTIAAVFLYQDDDTEIDIEFSRWGDEGAAENGEYVVQPYTHQGNRHQFSFALTGDESTHVIMWRPEAIEWKSMQGRQAYPEDNANLIQRLTYGGSDIPQGSACMHVHINHWLRQGLAPLSGQPSELVITDVRLPVVVFLPLVQRSVPTLVPPPPPTPTPTPSITVSAEGDRMWGTVAPAQYCNENYKVAAYAKTDLWYVQPYEDGRRNIRINPDCTWRSSTHAWDQVAAFLVTADFEIPFPIPKPNCPPPPLDPDSDPRILAWACFP